MARVTIFGANGDLGRYLTEELTSLKHDFHTFDRDSIKKLLQSDESIGTDFLDSDAFIFSVGSFMRKSTSDLIYDEISSEITSNLTLPIAITSLLCSKLDNSKKVNFIYIGSTSAYKGFAGTATYCASKFGLRGFVDAMNSEYSNLDFKFTLISMGTMASRMGALLNDQNPNSFLKISTVGNFVIESALMLDEAYMSEAIIMRRKIDFK
jgi:short-subunit dehydrogenase